MVSRWLPNWRLTFCPWELWLCTVLEWFFFGGDNILEGYEGPKYPHFPFCGSDSHWCSVFKFSTWFLMRLACNCGRWVDTLELFATAISTLCRIVPCELCSITLCWLWLGQSCLTALQLHRSLQQLRFNSYSLIVTEKCYSTIPFC